MATLSSTRNDVYETHAYIDYETRERTGDSVAYSWSFKLNGDRFTSSNDYEGQLYIRNLDPGEVYEIYAEVTITVGTQHEKTITNEDGTTSTETWWTYNTTEEWDALQIFTHPGPFAFGATNTATSSNSIIANVLSANKINNEWIPHFQNAYRWYTQQSGEYDVDLTVKQNESIKAEWFTKCLAAMRSVGKTSSEYFETIEAGKTIITAERINRLNFSGR